MKILIAEDDNVSRTILASVLAKGGHEVVKAINGTEAWQVLQRPNPPRLAILDWMMPEMDGLEVLRLVRSLPTICPPYIVMLTARDGNADIVAGLNAGANDYLTKPFEPNELLARVEVGQRIVEMQLLHSRRLERAQIFRVDTGRRLHELHDELAAKEAQLRRAQAALLDLEARPQRPQECCKLCGSTA
jgi:DNA-binding response OmpR family regulator